MDYIELEYTDLPVTFDYGPMDWETGYGTKEFDRDVSYTYKVDKNSVEEVILDLIPEDEYNEIVKKDSTSFDPVDETDRAYEYIESNFDSLFKRFEDEILDYFEQDASEEAARTIDPDDYEYDPFDEGLEMNENVSNEWSKDLQDKLNFLKNHKTHEGKFSRDVKVWDLDLTPEQRDYFYDFLESDFLEYFWDENKDLAKDIYQEGRSMGHLVLDVDYGEAPLEYDPFNFKVDDVDEAFELWCNNTYGLYSHEYAYTDEEMTELKQEFIDWFNNAYDTVVDFDDRAEKLVELFKQNLDNFIEQEKAPSDDLTETMFSEVEDIEEPELDDLNEYDEIDESYFGESGEPIDYTVEDEHGSVLYRSEDKFDAIDWAEENFLYEEPKLIRKHTYSKFVDEDELDSEVIWTASDYEHDDFEECYDDASDELPEMEEDLDYNPDFDDDFAGHHYTSYDFYKAQQEFSDEEAFEERDPDRYDDEHAKEWMKKHPHGWYNSESDYGVGDEEDFDESWNPYDEEDDEGEPFESYYVVRGKNGEWLADFDFEGDAIEFAEQDEKAIRVDTQTTYGPKIVWTRKVNEEFSSKAVDYNKYKLPHDVVDFIVKTAEKDIDERLYFNDHDWSSMDSSETSDWVMDRIEIQFPGWKWTDENMSYVEAIVDDVMDYFLKKDTSIDESLITEATMSDLDIEIQETGYDELIDKIQRNIDDLEREERFLTRQAPREIGKGGNFDSQEEIDSALAATQRELERERAKLAIVRGQQNG